MFRIIVLQHVDTNFSRQC